MGNRIGYRGEAWRLALYTAPQQRALRSAVIDVINSSDDCPTLNEFAASAGVASRDLRRSFGRRKILFEAVTESVILRSITVARRGRISTSSVDGIIEALVWHRLSVYEAVVPVLPAVHACRAGTRTFGLLVHAVTTETEFLLRRVMDSSQAAPCKVLLSDLDTTLSLLRLDDLRQGCGMSPASASSVLRSDVADVFTARGAGCLEGPDRPQRTIGLPGEDESKTARDFPLSMASLS